jgi:hypothetical protein
MVFNAYGQAAAIFVFVYGGALVGMAVQRLQPQHHRNDDSKETVKLVMGLLATMTALILGLADGIAYLLRSAGTLQRDREGRVSGRRPLGFRRHAAAAVDEPPL